jgi:hypothetical protein
LDPDDVPTVEEAAWTGLQDEPDYALPTIGAHWLASGLDSPELLALACLGSTDGIEARHLLPDVIRSLGYEPLIDRETARDDDLAWRGQWARIAWAVREIDGKLTVFAAAQYLLQVLDDEPDLWQPGRGDRLQRLVSGWDEQPERRPDIEPMLRAYMAALQEDDVPPVRSRRGA